MFVISLVNLLFCEIVGDKGKYSKTIIFVILKLREWLLLANISLRIRLVRLLESDLQKNILARIVAKILLNVQDTSLQKIRKYSRNGVLEEINSDYLQCVSDWSIGALRSFSKVILEPYLLLLGNCYG